MPLVVLAVSCTASDEPVADSNDPGEATTPPATTAEATTTAPASTTTINSTTTMVDPTTTTTVDTTTTTIDTTTTVAPSPGAEAIGASLDEILASGTILNLAHAGGDQAAPHSTMYAFREAVLAGANALELDVQLTADGVLVVQHDDTVDRTTNTTGPVAELTLDEIQTLDNAYWWSPDCWRCDDLDPERYVFRGVRTGDVPPPDGYGPDDFRVETLRDVATAFPDHLLDIEIKGSYPDAIAAAEALADLLVELDRVESSIVVSFDDQLIDAIHERVPDLAVSPGTVRLTEWFLNGAELEPWFRVLQLPPFQSGLEILTAETVQRIHDEGRFVWAWADDADSQENEEFYRHLLELGVDGIITGRPAEMTAAQR